MNRSEAIEIAKVLKALIKINEVSKLSNTFIKAFYEKSILHPAEGHISLHGNFNLGGTVSGRMSSNNPNLQNLPSTGTKYAKAFKKCFKAPEGYYLVGADFASLEDRISALTTKDPAKLQVYTEGYDGHCLRAYSYFKDQMEDIDPTNVESINSIESKYPDLRQKSKGPTFALTYQGTWMTLVKNLGFKEDLAKQIEARYHELYQVSDEWVQAKLAQAAKTGYVEVAFGMKVRTPILKQTILNKHNTPKEAAAESRTAGNALGQSYGLLNNRAANAFMDRVYNSEYRYDIHPIAQIHDSQYYLVRAGVPALKFLNDNLIECMSWQNLPDIQHDQVKLGAELELFYPDMSNGIKIPNNASEDVILDLIIAKKKEIKCTQTAQTYRSA